MHKLPARRRTASLPRRPYRSPVPPAPAPSRLAQVATWLGPALKLFIYLVAAARAARDLLTEHHQP